MKNEELRTKNVNGSGGRPTLVAPDAGATRWGFLIAAGSILLQTLREIFDEAAYTRFLKRHSATRSRESYAAFLRENRSHRESRARCC